ncbi:MAG TPA: hypothetical protein VHC63_18350 [Acidimicrobiales bacterium]|nr:hypothetical protein [Acidimicrobiales bacterium]
MAVQEREQLQQQLDIKEGRRSYWRLDPRTIARGKEGVRAAREALREAQARRAATSHHKHAA